MGVSFNTATIAASGITYNQQINVTLYGNMYERSKLGIISGKDALHAAKINAAKEQAPVYLKNQAQPSLPAPSQPITNEALIKAPVPAPILRLSLPLILIEATASAAFVNPLILIPSHKPRRKPRKQSQQIVPKDKVHPEQLTMALVLFYWDYRKSKQPY